MGKLTDFASDYFPFIPRPAPKFVTEDGKRVYGMMAEFTETPVVFHAAEHIRDAGYTQWDVHSPFPIHGIDTAMGMKPTILPRLAGGAAIVGVIVALLMQYYTNHWDFAFVVQGRDTAAWEAYLPITFELGVLATAFTCVFGMMALNGLPRFHHPLLSKASFLKVSDDRFVIAIEASDPSFDPEKTRAMLEAVGGTNIDLVEDED